MAALRPAVVETANVRNGITSRPEMRVSLSLILGLACCCARVAPEPPSTTTCQLPDVAGRQVLQLSLRVAKVGSGCDGVGGTPVMVSKRGQLHTRSVWQDPQASLMTEVWRGQFDGLVARSNRAGQGCVEATVDVGPGLYAVRTCHAPDSGATAPDGFVSFTQVIYYP